MQLVIRAGEAGDAAALSLVGGATFLESYAHMIPAADLLAHVAARHGADVYATWLADAGTRIRVATAPLGALVGYAVLTTPDLPADCVRDGDRELRRIYLMGIAQRRGAGAALMAGVLDDAAAMGAARVTVGVHGGNDRAITFYTRMGFAAIGRRTFSVGAQVYDDLVMGRRV
ncbi:GNAT family N-acetyltransferase [Sphingomonas montana]|uniref:GNAT family N-acetyltransferase n=1 Tax=Sphingomonas montana TaxID=1843236 RepID=UPI00096E3A11|nr:GNAT family N-acetyltransferase [Sphingomonas montana]